MTRQQRPDLSHLFKMKTEITLLNYSCTIPNALLAKTFGCPSVRFMISPASVFLPLYSARLSALQAFDSCCLFRFVPPDARLSKRPIHNVSCFHLFRSFSPDVQLSERSISDLFCFYLLPSLLPDAQLSDCPIHDVSCFCLLPSAQPFFLSVSSILLITCLSRYCCWCSPQSCFTFFGSL